MSDLKSFLANEITVSRGTKDHDRFIKYLKEAFAELDALGTTVLVTKGCQPLSHHAAMTSLELNVADQDFRFGIARGLLDDSAFDLAGYLLMVTGRTVGNYLRAEALDGDGRLFVRFGRDWDLRVRHLGAEQSVEMYQVTISLAVARHPFRWTATDGSS